MRYFKDNNNKLYAYNDNVKQETIKPGLVEITTDEYKSFKVFKVFDKSPEEVQVELDNRENIKLVNSKIKEIETAYNNANQEDIEYKDTVFQADEKSQQLIVNVLSAGTVPEGFWWLDKDNNQIPMTYEELQGLSATILVRGQANFTKLQELKTQVLEAGIDELDTIVWGE